MSLQYVVDAKYDRQVLATSSKQPLLSVVVPAYEAPQRYLEACIRSVQSQVYPAWELIVVDDASRSIDVREVVASAAADDARIKFVRRETNGNIAQATNDGLHLASGEFVLFLDHDDELSPDALLRFAEALMRAPEIDVWYSDQVTVDPENRILTHFFKPDWSPTYFLGAMYVGHLLGVRRSLALAVGGLDSNYDGVQDFEFMLRISERTQRIGHIRRVLYNWRAISGSLASNSNAKVEIEAKQARAVNAHLARIGRSWNVRPHGALPHRLIVEAGERTRLPPVSIIIPSRDLGEVVERCLSSIFELTDYPDFEVVVVDNGTVDPRALTAFRRFPVTVVPFEEEFNFSRANNLGVGHSKNELLVFLNNDTEILNRNWLRDMVLYFEDPGVGAIGPVLLYPDRRVQHAGVVLGCRGTADHVMRFFPENVDGYGGSLACSREVSAVTGAALLMRRNLYLEVGGFSEDFSKHYQDVDLCLKIQDAGYRIICVAGAQIIHHESLSRRENGYDLVDRAILIDRWHEKIQEPDPYYNPHLDRERLDYSASSRRPPQAGLGAQVSSVKRAFDILLNEGPISLCRKIGAAMRNRGVRM